MKSETKTCKVCEKILTKKNWPHWRKRIRHRVCYQCGLDRYREWYKKSSKSICIRQKAYRRKLKKELIEANGGANLNQFLQQITAKLPGIDVKVQSK